MRGLGGRLGLKRNKQPPLSGFVHFFSSTNKLFRRPRSASSHTPGPGPFLYLYFPAQTHSPGSPTLFLIRPTCSGLARDLPSRSHVRLKFKFGHGEHATLTSKTNMYSEYMTLDQSYNGSVMIRNMYEETCISCRYISHCLYMYITFTSVLFLQFVWHLKFETRSYFFDLITRTTDSFKQDKLTHLVSSLCILWLAENKQTMPITCIDSLLCAESLALRSPGPCLYYASSQFYKAMGVTIKITKSCPVSCRVSTPSERTTANIEWHDAQPFAAV